MSQQTKEVLDAGRVAAYCSVVMIVTIAAAAFGARTLLSQADTLANLLGVAIILVMIYFWIFLMPKWGQKLCTKKVTVTSLTAPSFPADNHTLIGPSGTAYSCSCKGARGCKPDAPPYNPDAEVK